MSEVSFVKIKKSNRGQAIAESLRLINYNFPKHAKNIVIKANMCYYWDYSTGQTTDPQFIAGLIDVIRQEISPDVNIYVVEADASAMKCKFAFKFLGYEDLAKNCNVQLFNLSNDKASLVETTANGLKFRFMLPELIRTADVKINVTKIKYSHKEIQITCALKNIFGCNPYPKKFRYHTKLSESIVAINKAMPFDLHLIDGNIVAGDGVRKLGLVMASEDPVAMDAAAAKIAGVNPSTIKFLKLAEKEGLGKKAFIPRGIPIGYFICRYPCKRLKKKIINRGFELVILLKLGKRLGLE